MSDAYGNVMGGKLKLKGGLKTVSDKKKKKKKKRKRTREEREADDDREAVAALEAADFAKSEADGDAGGKEEEEEDYRTAAEKRFDEVKKQREIEEARKNAKKSHRDRVDELNAYLTKLPIHHDIPKVASAGNG